MAKPHTSGPWTLGHFADPTARCNCTYVFADDGRMGAIASIRYSTPDHVALSKAEEAS